MIKICTISSIALLATICGIFSFTNFELARSFFDHFAADGSADLYTSNRHISLSKLIIAMSFSFLLCSLGLGIWWDKFANRTYELRAILHQDLKLFFSDSKEFIFSKIHCLSVFEKISFSIILFLGVLVRLRQLNIPLSYDEATTYLSFSCPRVSFFYILADYSLPNNHIFHSLLAKFFINLLGDNWISLRMPAFLSGILLLPLSFLAAIHYANKNIALIVTAFFAFSPLLIQYSVEARGYSLVGVFTIILFLLLDYRKKNEFAGLLLSGVIALGLLTIPVFLSAVAVSIIYWTFQTFSAKNRISKADFFPIFKDYLLGGALSILMYSPILVLNGFDSFLNNKNSVSKQPLSQYPSMLFETVYSLLRTNSVGTIDMLDAGRSPFFYMFLGAFLWGLIKINRAHPIKKIFAAITIWLIFFPLLFRTVPADRVWLIFSPFFIIACGLGLESLVGKKFLVGIALGLATLIFFGDYFDYLPLFRPQARHIAVQKYAESLIPILNEQDRVYAEYPLEAPMGANLDRVGKKKLLRVNYENYSDAPPILGSIYIIMWNNPGGPMIDPVNKVKRYAKEIFYLNPDKVDFKILQTQVDTLFVKLEQKLK